MYVSINDHDCSFPCLEAGKGDRDRFSRGSRPRSQFPPETPTERMIFETSPGNNAGGPSKIETSLCELGWVYLWPNCVMKSAFCLPFCKSDIRPIHLDTSWYILRSGKLISQQILPDGDRYCWNLVGWFSCCTSGRRQGGTWNSNSSLVKSHDVTWYYVMSCRFLGMESHGCSWSRLSPFLGSKAGWPGAKPAASCTISILFYMVYVWSERCLSESVTWNVCKASEHQRYQRCGFNTCQSVFVNFNLFQMCFKWRTLSYPCFFLGIWKSNDPISKLEMVLRLWADKRLLWLVLVNNFMIWKSALSIIIHNYV